MDIRLQAKHARTIRMSDPNRAPRGAVGELELIEAYTASARVRDRLLVSVSVAVALLTSRRVPCGPRCRRGPERSVPERTNR